MSISAAQVKELRERTGAGMMECKKALVAADGDIEAAIEAMRKSGQAKADKKAGRIAAEGAIVVATADNGGSASILEINCETDFVASDENFRNFADKVAVLALASQATDIESLNGQKIDAQTVDEARRDLVAKIGENIQLRRVDTIKSDGVLASYLHGTRIGVLVSMTGGDAALARDIAMHVAASNPACVSEDQVAPETLSRERDILVEQAAAEGKPDEIVQRMVEGRMKKFLAEITLVGQPFVKDPDITVGQLLRQNEATVRHFIRYEVGEGIEKKTENFAEEVMAQVQSS